MAISMFDQHLFQFRCQCGHVEPIVLGRLDDVTRWTCERCGYCTDLRARAHALRIALGRSRFRVKAKAK